MARTGENIYKRKDGRWEARYILFYDENGKAKYRYLYAKTYAEVKNKLFNEQTQTINFIRSKSNITYSKWLDDWLISKKLIVKESTYIRYKNTIENHIKPELGKYPINKISTELVESFIANKMQNGKKSGGGLSIKSISDIMVIIKETFKFAQSHGEIINCTFSRLPIRKTTNEMRVLSVAEEQKLVSIVSNNIDRYKLGILICLYTGIRIGELCALKCKNISITDKTLKIEATMQRLQCDDYNCLSKTKIIITDPKTYNSVRIIPLPDFLLEKMMPFITMPNAYLLSGNSIDIVEPRTMQNRFKSYLKQGMISDANFHSLRHTYALETLIKYYYDNRQEGTDWVVLPVANFDAYFGSTSFSKKRLTELVKSGAIERENSYNVSRYRVNEVFL